MDKRTVFVHIFYSVLVVTVVASLALIYGLIYHHAVTLSILYSTANIGLIVTIFISICILTPKITLYLHDNRMRKEAYELAKQERMKVSHETKKLQMDAYAREQEAYVKQMEAYRIEQEIIMQNKRLAIDIEVARTRMFIEQRQASFIRVNVNERMYLQEGNDFRQIAEAHVPVRALSSRSTVNADVPHVSLPYAPTFAHMQELIISETHLVLGYTDKKPVYGTLEDHLLSMLFTGRPKTGKSTAILYYAAMFLKVGVLPIILDPQGSLQELEGILPYRNSMQSIHDFIPLLYGEFSEREELWRKGRMLKPYSLVVIIDELPMIAAWEEQNVRKGDYTVLDMIQKIILELRKLHVYTIAAGQGFPAYIMPTLSRENTSSRLVFPTTERYAKMAGLSDKTVKTMLPLLDAVDRGTGILDVSCEKEPYLINIPFTEVSDLVLQIEGNAFYSDIINKFSDGAIVDSTGRALTSRQSEELYHIPSMDAYTQQVYQACLTLSQEGKRLTVANVWSIVRGDKTRISDTIKKLIATGDLQEPVREETA